MTFRRILALAVIAIAAPIASHAQANNPCGVGYTYTPLPGGGFQCIPITTSAPEIGASSSIGGVAVLVGGALMLRGRKRKVALSAEAVA
jgi:hypothetical protein